MEGMSSVRWGVVGPGRIAAKVVRDFVHLPDAEVVAIASRSAERARAFADANGVGRAHGSYRAIVEDDEVDALYIATPHPQHRAVALAALKAGKALLVEKTFTVTPGATREIAAAAAEAGVFVMEAMWTRFQPAIVRMRELLDGGAIGDIRGVQGELGVNAPTDPQDRYYNPAVGGGALFDLTVYPVSFAQMVLGTPDTVVAHGALAPSGVDVEEAVLLGWAGGRTASLFTSLRCATPGQMRVFGTEGWIDVMPRFHHPDTIVLHRTGREAEEVTVPHTGGGYVHELREVTDGVLAGTPESAVMPLADTIAVQDVLGAVADQLGMSPQEGPAELP
jgi:predicted dehydrogenase